MVVKYFLEDGRPLKEACVLENVSYTGVLDYSRRYNLSFDEAFEHAKQNEPRKETKLPNGETIKEFCGKIGVSTAAFYARTKLHKETPDEAFRFFQKKYGKNG